MAKTIHLRNVPDSLHRRLTAQAAMAELSLSDFIVGELRRIVRQPSPDDIRERLRQREPYSGKVSPTDVLRNERDSWGMRL